VYVSYGTPCGHSQTTYIDLWMALIFSNTNFASALYRANWMQNTSSAMQRWDMFMYLYKLNLYFDYLQEYTAGGTTVSRPCPPSPNVKRAHTISRSDIFWLNFIPLTFALSAIVREDIKYNPHIFSFMICAPRSKSVTVWSALVVVLLTLNLFFSLVFFFSFLTHVFFSFPFFFCCFMMLYWRRYHVHTSFLVCNAIMSVRK
jgi:hypothetical protein